MAHPATRPLTHPAANPMMLFQSALSTRMVHHQATTLLLILPMVASFAVKAMQHFPGLRVLLLCTIMMPAPVAAIPPILVHPVAPLVQVHLWPVAFCCFHPLVIQLSN